MKVVGIIPVRMASSRFPGKPLAKIRGIPMVEHVVKRSAMAKGLDGLYVATCDQEIVDVVERFGGKAIMTSSSHERCTDRVAEAIAKVGGDPDIVINIQGDEPMLEPGYIEAMIHCMKGDSGLDAANLVVPIQSESEHRNPNFVKVVQDRRGFALYFSREPIPSCGSESPDVQVLRQTGIIAFTSRFLRTFSELEPTALEKAESVDMLRALEHGYQVKLVFGAQAIYTVDTEQDRNLVEEKMKEDKYLHLYARRVSGEAS